MENATLLHPIRTEMVSIILKDGRKIAESKSWLKIDEVEVSFLITPSIKR
jgi:hypothetical protein